MTATLTAAEVATILQYRSTQTIRQLYRDGRFPPPIDPELPVRHWRWSRRMVEAYIEGGAR